MSDLLEELKAERAKCFRVGNEKYGFVCDGCGVDWPCPLSRALDGMIAGVEIHHIENGYPYCVECDRAYPCETVRAITRAYRGDDAEEK